MSFCNSTQFRDLEILQAKGDTVTFHASLLQNGNNVSFTEKSLFEKVGKQWYYKKKLAHD